MPRRKRDEKLDPLTHLNELSLHEAVCERIGEDLRDVFGEMAEEIAPDLFRLCFGERRYIMVRIHERSEADSVVEIRKYLSLGRAAKPKLIKRLMELNHQLVQGSFGLDEDGDIFIHHRVLSRLCDRGTLKQIVLPILGTADGQLKLIKRGTRKRRP